MIAIATTDTTIAAAYRWEARTLVATQRNTRVGAGHRNALSGLPGTAATTPTPRPSDLPTLVFLAGN